MLDISAFASSLIIVATVLLPVACWLGLRKAALPGDRSLVSMASAILLLSWLFASMQLCIGGAFHPSADALIPGVPNTAPLLVLAFVATLTLLLAARPLRRALDEVPNAWLVGAQGGRLMGFVVLSLGMSGVLPMSFAGPAGWGDGMTGIAAPFVAYALHRRKPWANVIAWAWNVFGLADLITVALLAAQTTPGTALFRPEMGDNSSFTIFPLGLLGVVYGPLFIVLHVCSMRATLRSSKLLRAAIDTRSTARPR